MSDMPVESNPRKKAKTKRNQKNKKKKHLGHEDAARVQVSVHEFALGVEERDGRLVWGSALSWVTSGWDRRVVNVGGAECHGKSWGNIR